MNSSCFMILSAVLLGQEPPENLPQHNLWKEPPLTPWEMLWIWLSSGPFWVCYVALLIWMLYYCVRHDPARWFWVWIMLIVQPFGAIAYFLIRYLPSADFSDWSLWKRWKKRQALPQLESAASQIGNAYQHVQFGDALRELKRFDRAADAYAKALEKEPTNLAALWGAASVEFERREFSSAKTHLAAILEQDASYKFGDVSLLYAKTLLELNEKEPAREHLEQHVRKWRHPEALYLLARLCSEQGDINQARSHLQGLIQDLNSSPKAIARKHLFWKTRARRLLRHLPAS